MVGNAIFTILLSRVAMKVPKATVNKIAHFPAGFSIRGFTGDDKSNVL